MGTDAEQKPTIEDLIKDIDTLVSFPGVAMRVNQMVDDPDCSASELANVVSQDPALTARVLSLANSPIYGMSQQIDTVSRAITIIGIQRLRDMVLATGTMEAFDGIPNDLITMENFWSHSIYTGLAAKILATHVKVLNSESLFVAGLLHDIGQLVMFIRIPDWCRKAFDLCLKDDSEPGMHQCEYDVLGFDHGEVGAKLAEHWKLPGFFYSAIAYHHHPEQATDYQMETALIHIANSIAVMTELHSDGPEGTDAPVIAQSAWDITGLDESVIAPTIEEIRNQYEDVRSQILA